MNNTLPHSSPHVAPPHVAPPHVTEEGTVRYRERFAQLAPGHFRHRYGIWMSSIGAGTYLGEHSEQSSANYVESIKAALQNGCNVLDTAINYRMMQSERDIGTALQQLIASGQIQRDEVLICTKGGYIPYDGEVPENPLQDLERRFFSTGIAKPEEVVGHMHCMAPDYLSSQIETSLHNLQLQTLDVYYLHNPETQLNYVTPSEFLKRMRAAIIRLEEEVALGRLLAYGIATWNGLRADDKARDYLPLQMLVNIAHEIAGEEHHFRFIQFPYNLGMLDALNVHNQAIEHRTADGQVQTTKMQLLAAAYQMGIVAITSATLLQQKLLGRIPAKLKQTVAGLQTDAQYAIHFNRSTPGVTTTLVGMGKPEHAVEDMAVAKVEPLTQEEFFAKFSK